MYKRESSHLIEEEDEWEREAYSNNKRLQPNLFAKNIDILDEQYNVLSDTTISLEEQLISLQNTLKDLDKEEQVLIVEQQQLKSEYIESVENTVSLLKETDKKDQDNIKYIKSNEILCKDLNYRLNQWEKIFELKLEQEELIEKKIKKLVHEYRYTEFDIIDLTAQIEGFQSLFRSLNQETSRLKALPQIIPILKTETENYKLELQNTTKLLERLEIESIKPALIELSKLKIALPLKQDQFKKSIQYIDLMENDLKEIFEIGIKQRSIQFFISMMNQIKNETIISTNTLKETIDNIENTFTLINIEKDYNTDNDDDNNQLELLNKLLNEFIELKRDDLSSFKQDMTLVEKINALKIYKQKLEMKWSQDFNSCLDAIGELDDLKSRLSNTLFTHSQSNNELILTPESYSNLQETLLKSTDELKEKISTLQKEIENPNENSLFKKRRKLFSVFYTDPEEFLDLIEKN